MQRIAKVRYIIC